MVKLEATFLDRMLNGAFLAKRHLGRPLKYNIRSKGRLGYLHSLHIFLPLLLNLNSNSV